MTDKTMDEIKPVAWMVWLPLSERPPQFTTDPTTPVVMAERADYICTPLYDSAALAAARKEGEIAGMREATKIACDNSASDYQFTVIKNAINRAIQEKSK